MSKVRVERANASYLRVREAAARCPRIGCRRWSGLALSMAERKAITKEMALRYHRAPKQAKGRMLDELCAPDRLAP